MSEPWESEPDDQMLSEWDVAVCFGDDPDPNGDAEYAAWLRGLPADIRADYLSRSPAQPFGAYPCETEPAGFTHHDVVPGSGGIGFAAGGAHDLLLPGPDLAWLAAATDASRAELGESELIGVLCAWRRLTSWAQAGQAATLITLTRRRDAQARELGRPSLVEHVSDEIAAALRLTSRSANLLLDAAGGLDRLPDVQAALKRGELDWAKACLFVDLLAALSDDDAREIAAALLGRAGDMTTGQLRAALTRAVLAHDPQAAERRREAARAETGVHAWTESSGNAGLAGRELATADVIHADVRLTAIARWLRRRGATGTMDQLRAAVYIALLTGRAVESLLPPGPGDLAAEPDAGDAGPPTDSGPVATAPVATAPVATARGPQLTGTINLTMPISAWLGITGNPGEIVSHGPVDAETCRRLAAAMDPATQWCLTVTNQAGHAVAHACAPRSELPPRRDQARLAWAASLVTRLQYFEAAPCSHARESAGYTPSRKLRHLIEIRQRRCAAPGCRRAAVRCDLDHTVPFDQGGRTCECNLAPLCRRHHRAKQTPGWHLEQRRPGEMTWRLPSGRVYQTVSDPY
jgi:hypothetical protein